MESDGPDHQGEREISWRKPREGGVEVSRYS